MQTVDAPWTVLFFLARTIHIPIIPLKTITGEPLRDDKLTSFPCLTGLKKNFQVSLFTQQRKKQILFFVLFFAWNFFLLFFFYENERFPWTELET